MKRYLFSINTLIIYTQDDIFDKILLLFFLKFITRKLLKYPLTDLEPITLNFKKCNV